MYLISDVSPFLKNHWFACFWTSAPGFKARVDPLLVCYIVLYNGFLRFTCGVTHAYLLMASITAKPFLIHILTLVELEPNLGLNVWYSVRPNRLSHLGSSRCPGTLLQMTLCEENGYVEFQEI